DLVRNVAPRRRPVGPGDAEIDLAVLHQMAADIVDDDGVRHAVLAKLPGGQAGPLVARARLVNPDMDGDTVVMGAEHRGKRGAPIDGGEPAGIAMGQEIDRRGAVLAIPGGADERAAMRADRAIDRDVLLADLGRAPECRQEALPRR